MAQRLQIEGWENHRFQWGNKKLKPKGDQPQAIKKLVDGILTGKQFQTLKGLTGTGKTFTIANVIYEVQKPTLVISHNKTLAAQLYQEFREFFPKNAVEFFTSFYTYYQPESYLPAEDLYIEKDFGINEEIERLRLSATRSILERRDVIIVASVSCIYGLGSPDHYRQMSLNINVLEEIDRDTILNRLIDIQYERNDNDFQPGTFRVRGDILDIFPPYQDTAIRIEFFGDEVDSIAEIHPLTGKKIQTRENIFIFPAKHYVTPRDIIEKAIEQIEEDLKERVAELRAEGKLVEAQRLEQRTKYDIEQLKEFGWCKGIENYSRYFDGRKPGEPVYTLIDYFPKDYLLIIDECHMTIPQLRAMYHGDYSRKKNLVEYGFRLPAAFDNRPLKFEEFEERMGYTIFVSATPDEYSIKKSKNRVIRQIIRPTGLLDPKVEVRPVANQVEDLIGEIKNTVNEGWRVLVTTLTKRMAENLTDYLQELNIKAQYLHSDIDTLERTDIIRNLRLGKINVIVGINLLREGLDLPEVALVGVLDADKEGFLRDYKSLIQVIGRAARNANGRAILYADKITRSINAVIKEINENRKLQMEYNKKHGIIPQTIIKPIAAPLVTLNTDYKSFREGKIPLDKLDDYLDALESELKVAVQELDFERAAELRDLLLKYNRIPKIV